jgi:hypothetical protein
MLNPVRAHLQQLQEATKEPYRLTIEVVALMFDAILADKLLQPLAARLIARLQLPLLDVALSDPDLFTRTTHPLHALVNRLGNAAAAFDVYETGPGQRFYAAALSIVEEILEGDFLSLETYRGALDKLNAFVKHEAQIDNPFHSDAAHVLAAKELSVHLEHHLSTQVTPLIQQMPIQAFLRDFFLQTWVRAQVEAVLRYGEKSPESHRYSRMCSDLVWSVQPKTTADDKRQLVAALPHLMRDVNEAFALLKWPALAQKEFRGRLIEHQARAMKGLGEDGEPIAEGYRSEEGERAIAALKSLAIPAMEELQARTIDPASLNADECAFTEAERNVTGFLRDDEVSEAALADVPLFEEPEQDSPDTEDESPTENEFPSLDGEIGQEKNRAMNSGEAFKVKIGGEWRKLRLAWVSDMRSFYLFDDCADVKHKFTFSSKTLARLWVDEEIHLFETESLMARAIAATRKSLLAPH